MSKSIIELLNRRMPTLLNIRNEIYESFVGKVDFTPNSPITKSSDYQCGAIANELEYLKGYIDYVTANIDVETMEE